MNSNITTAQQNTIALAKQGDAKAIEVLINYALGSKGITAKAALKNGCLQIMLESDDVLAQETLVAPIHKSIVSLGSDSITKIKIYGRQTGDEFPSWSKEFEVVVPTTPLFLELAKQGDVNAISAMIHQCLKSQAILVKANLKDGCLQIILESVPAPEQETVIPLLRDSLMSLDIQSCKKVKIYGRETDDDFPDWIQELDMRIDLRTQVDFNQQLLPTPLAKTVIITPGSQQPIQVWKCVNTLRGHSNGVNYVAFSLDGQTFASGSNDDSVKLWQLSTGAELKTLTGHSGWWAGVRSTAFNPDGQTLVSGSDDNTIKLWQIASGKEIHTFTGHTNGVSSVAISPDGQTLVSGGISPDNTVKLWQLSTGKEIRTFAGHTDGVYSVAISPDGQTIASGSNDKTIKFWRLDTGEELFTLVGHLDKLTSVAFSPDGQILASGSADKTIMLWHIDGRKLIRTLIGHSDKVLSVAFSPTNQTLASSSADKTIKLWQLDTGDQIRTLTGHSSQVTSIAFSPDGLTLVSGSHDKSIMIWQCD